MYSYPVELTPDPDGGFVATFPDVPGAVTQGENEPEALRYASDALETMFMALIADSEAIPRPSDARGRPRVALPALSAAKVALYEAMRAQGVDHGELASRLGCSPAEVGRLLDLLDLSGLDRIEAALRALGKTIVLEIRDAA